MVVVVHISPRKAADVASVAGLPCGHGHRRTARCSAARAVRRQVTRRRGSVCGCAKTRERRRGSGVAEIPSGALLSCLTARRAHAGRAARGRPATPCELQRQSPNAARRVCRRLGAAGGYDWLWGTERRSFCMCLVEWHVTRRPTIGDGGSGASVGRGWLVAAHTVGCGHGLGCGESL